MFYTDNKDATNIVVLYQFSLYIQKYKIIYNYNIFVEVGMSFNGHRKSKLNEAVCRGQHCFPGSRKSS
jgi:hypothetical protein